MLVVFINKKQLIYTGICLIIVISLISSELLFSKIDEKEDKNKLEIVTTFYPLTFFTKEIGGDNIKVKTLMPFNTEPHVWQSKPSDIISVDKADIIIYNGADLDHWFEEDILPSIDKKNKIIIESTSGIDLKKIENVVNENHEPEHHEHSDIDPHTWISPFIAKQQAEKIYFALIEKDPINSNFYLQNWNKLIIRFEEMDKDFSEGLINKTKNTIFVTHSAFGYLAQRYDFEQIGVIGLSTEEQPSISKLTEIVDLMKEYETYVIYIDPIYTDNYATVLKNELEKETNKDVKVLKLYLMLGPVDNLDYFQMMEKNLENLQIGLHST